MTSLDLNDMSYSVTNDGIWSTLEPSLGIVNACLPLLKPLGQRLRGRVAYFQKRRRTKSFIHDKRLAVPRYFQAKAEAHRRGSYANDDQRQHTVFPSHEGRWFFDDAHSSWRFEYTGLRTDHKGGLYRNSARNNRTEREGLPITEAWAAPFRTALPVYVPHPATKLPVNREGIVIRDEFMMETSSLPFERQNPDYFQSRDAGMNWV